MATSRSFRSLTCAGYTGMENIGPTLAPIMIRRRKSEVLLAVPSRTDHNLLVPRTGMQMVHHPEERGRARAYRA